MIPAVAKSQVGRGSVAAGAPGSQSRRDSEGAPRRRQGGEGAEAVAGVRRRVPEGRSAGRVLAVGWLLLRMASHSLGNALSTLGRDIPFENHSYPTHPACRTGAGNHHFSPAVMKTGFSGQPV